MLDDSEGNNFSAGGKIEMAQDGAYFSELTQANARVASAVVQAEIPYEEDIADGKKDKLFFTLDSCAKNVRLAISFSGGLYSMDSSSGAKKDCQATVVPSYSLDGGKTWVEFQFNQYVAGSYVPEVIDEQSIVHSHASSNPNRHDVYFDFFGVSDGLFAKDGYTLVRAECMGPDLWHWTGGFQEKVVDTYKHRYTYQKIVQRPIYSLRQGNDFTRNTINEIRFEAVHEFTLSDYAALKANGADQIQIQLVNKSAIDTNSRNSCVLLYYESQCFEPDDSQEPAGVLSAQEYSAKFPGGGGLEMSKVVSPKAAALSTMMAVRMKASAGNEDKLQKINILTNSVARVFDGNEWSQDRKATSNPAAIMLEILTSGSQPLSAFSDEEIEMDAFAGLFDFCARNGIEFNAVQTQKTMKGKLLENICSVCRAALYWNAEGKLSVAWDDRQDTIVANLDADSLISVDNEKELARPVDAMRLTYADSSDWTQKTAVVLNSGVTELQAESVIKDLSVTGITSAEQVVKYGRYLMACMNIRKKTVSVKVGNEGICFSPCSRITVKDDSLGDTPQDLLVTGAFSNGDGWTLKCVDYDERVYESGEIPRYISRITQESLLPLNMPSNFVTKGELDELKGGLASGEISVGKPNAPVIAAAVAKRDGISLEGSPLGNGARNALLKVLWQVAKAGAEPQESDWTDFAETADVQATYAFDRSVDGFPERADFASWRFRAKAVNAYGKESEWSEPAAVTVNSYGTWQVGQPDEVTHRVSGRTATLAFDQPQRADGLEVYGDIQYKIEIKKGASKTDEWFVPADDEDPYESEENWKDGGAEAVPCSDGSTPITNEYLKSGKSTTHAFSQTLPLEGQNDLAYQYEWFYVCPASDEAHRKLDSYGNPCKESAGTSWSKTNPSSDWQAVTRVYGENGSVYGYFSDVDEDGDGINEKTGFGQIHGELGETGEETFDADVFKFRDAIYELVENEDGEWNKVFYDGKFYAINGGVFTIGENTFRIDGDAVRLDGDTGTYDIYAVKKTLSYKLVDGFDPVDTVYIYKVRAYNTFGSRVVSYSDARTITVTALATSVKDVVEGAITHNKLAEGAVWVDNLAAGSVTAEKMAVRDLFAITGVFGKIQNNEIKSSSHNFWDLESGRFHVGNSASIDPLTGENSDSDEAEYIDYTPSSSGGSLALKIANFIVRAISSIIQGVFIIRSKLDASKRVMVVANPEDSSQSDCPARTVKINGDFNITGTMTGLKSLTIKQTLGSQSSTDTYDGSIDKEITIKGYNQSLNTSDDVKFNSISFSGHSGELSVSRMRLDGSTLYINC